MYTCLKDIKNIPIGLRVKCIFSNGKQIFSDYVICMKLAYRRITTAEMTSQCRQSFNAENKESTSLSRNY